jgi:hypothetical protein
LRTGFALVGTKLQSMRVRIERERPEPWLLRKKKVKRTWTKPLWAFNWFWEWITYLLSNWSFLDALDYLSRLSVLVAVTFYFSEAGDRLKQKHYQAWLVIDAAQGKGGNGGRIDALQELNGDNIPLIGVDVSGAFLRGIQLRHARLPRSNFSAADVRDAALVSSDLSDSDLHYANFRRSSLKNANLERSNLDNADFFGADLSNANLSEVTLDNADLQGCDISDIQWRSIRSIKNANIFGIKNAPIGFVSWALHHGGVQVESEAQ